MTTMNDALAEFGRRAGLTDFQLSRTGCAQLRAASGRLLSFEAMRDALLVSVSAPVDRPLVCAEWLLNKVNLCQSTHTTPILVGLGPNDEIILTMRLLLSQLEKQSVDAAVSVLLELSRRATVDRTV